MDCLSKPCLNGGTCTDGNRDYTCACPPGYSDKNCTTYTNACAATPSPCANGASCTDDGKGGYGCACSLDADFGGVNCTTQVRPATLRGVSGDVPLP